MGAPTRFFRNRLVIAVAAMALGGAIAGRIAYASIPNSQSKVISGCYNSTSGALRVIDKQAGKKCSSTEKLLEWNQKGPKGLRWRGAWSSSTNYSADDAVSLSGNAWIALNGNTNMAPGSNATVWSLLASKGKNGLLFYAQSIASGPLPRTYTWSNVPAGEAVVHLSGTGFRYSAGAGYVHAAIGGDSDCGASQNGLTMILFFNQTSVHAAMPPTEGVACFNTPGTRSITVSGDDVVTDANDVFTVSLSVFAT